MGSGEANGGKAVAGRGIRGEVVGWYLPARVVDEEALSGAGLVVVVQMRSCSGQVSWGIHTWAVGIRSRREWCRHTVSTSTQQEGVGVDHRQAGPCRWAGGAEVLVLGRRCGRSGLVRIIVLG